ncbi:Cas8a1 family CRISPR/Cas system-associated protein [Gimesia aquarii]
MSRGRNSFWRVVPRKEICPYCK